MLANGVLQFPLQALLAAAKCPVPTLRCVSRPAGCIRNPFALLHRSTLNCSCADLTGSIGQRLKRAALRNAFGSQPTATMNQHVHRVERLLFHDALTCQGLWDVLARRDTRDLARIGLVDDLLRGPDEAVAEAAHRPRLHCRSRRRCRLDDSKPR